MCAPNLCMFDAPGIYVYMKNCRKSRRPIWGEKNGHDLSELWGSMEFYIIQKFMYILWLYIIESHWNQKPQADELRCVHEKKKIDVEINKNVMSISHSLFNISCFFLHTYSLFACQISSPLYILREKKTNVPLQRPTELWGVKNSRNCTEFRKMEVGKIKYFHHRAACLMRQY